uniref:Uncharacterized protein n=1 Tax=Rhizophora mucronata TaxID=61149 RepID=A0A2P2PH73_RHIMU
MNQYIHNNEYKRYKQFLFSFSYPCFAQDKGKFTHIQYSLTKASPRNTGLKPKMVSLD